MKPFIMINKNDSTSGIDTAIYRLYSLDYVQSLVL